MLWPWILKKSLKAMTTRASYRKVSEGVISEHTTYNKVTSLFPALVLGPGEVVKSLLNMAQAAFEGCWLRVCTWLATAEQIRCSKSVQ